MHSITPEELFFKWEAFIISIAPLSSSVAGSSKPKAPKFNLENVQQLKKEMSLASEIGKGKERRLNGDGGTPTVKGAKKKGGGEGL
jgi:hypothetical protein